MTDKEIIAAVFALLGLFTAGLIGLCILNEGAPPPGCNGGHKEPAACLEEEYRVLRLDVLASTDVSDGVVRGHVSSVSLLVFAVTAECSHGRRKVVRVGKAAFEALREGGMLSLPACEEFLALKQKEAECAED